MDENLNLVEILKDCPQGTKLYSPIYGDVEFVCVLQNEGVECPIQIKMSDDAIDSFTKDGRMFAEYKGECMLFPSREERNWSKFKPKKPKFDPKTFNPFDRVIARDDIYTEWRCELFSHIKYAPEYSFHCIYSTYKCCIPYNEETKHLVGTTDKAPEFYRYWED